MKIQAILFDIEHS